MDYRTKSFQEKFTSASAVLGVPPQEIMSVKVRDMVNSYGEYDSFFHELEHRHNLKLASVSGQFQGKGFSLSDDRNTVILVEHETGLEILYIAGSVASLISLVPLVVQKWRAFRQHRQHRPGHEPHEIEIRRLDAAGNLIEEHAHSFDGLHHGAGGPDSFPLAALLENEIRRINAQLAALTTRVHGLETPKKSARKMATKKRVRAKRND
jgi:hypothetical protein